MTAPGRMAVVGVACGLAVLLAGPAAADTLAIAPMDVPLEIRGTISSSVTSFGVNARLTLTTEPASTAAVPLRMLATDLKSSDGNVVIDRSGIAIASGVALSPGQPTDVRVTVSNVLQPGHYSGTVTFAAGASATSETPLTLDITDALKVTPQAETKTIRVLRCSWLIMCEFGDLTTRSSDDGKANVLVENETRNEVRTADHAVVLRGETRGTADAGAVEVVRPEKLRLRSFESFAVDVDSGKLEPDKYTGSIRLTVEDYADVTSIPIEVLVRDGPGWVVLTLVLGIIVGRVVRSQSTPAAQIQLELRPRYEDIRRTVDSVHNAGARHHLEDRLAGLKGDIDAARKTADALRADVDALQAEAVFFADLERLEGELRSNRALQPHKDHLQPTIDDARAALIRGDKPAADAARANVKQKVNELLAKLTEDGVMGPEDSDALAARVVPEDRESVKETSKRAEQHDYPVGRTSQVLAILAGISAPSAAVRYWFIRPLLWVVLLFILLLLGMQFLYIDKDTFGVNGLWDYFGLFLWGLTADVAAGTLQRLPSKPA